MLFVMLSVMLRPSPPLFRGAASMLFVMLYSVSSFKRLSNALYSA